MPKIRFSWQSLLVICRFSNTSPELNRIGFLQDHVVPLKAIKSIILNFFDSKALFFHIYIFAAAYLQTLSFHVVVSLKNSFGV